MTPRIGVVGSLNVDLVARCSRLPQPGETVGGAEFRRIPGGKGANQAVAAARLGADVRFVGRVGSDRFALAALAREGVDVSRVAADEGESGVALILVDDAGENVIVVAPGANGRLAPEQAAVEGVDAVLCQLEVPVAAVAAAAEGAPYFCLNAAPAVPVPDELVRRADLVVVNRYELDALGATPRLTALTLGAEGAVLLEDGKELVRASAPKVVAVDGTAAGDAFCAALLVYLLRGRDPEQALRLGCAAGAIAASRLGAQPSLPTAAEVEALAGAGAADRSSRTSSGRPAPPL